MMQVMMAAPFDAKGRYRGGVSAVANGIWERAVILEQQGIRLIPFDTCRIPRRKESAGKLRLENIRNFFRLLRDVKQQLRREKPQVFYMHSSVGWALIKDLRALKLAKKQGCKTVLHIHSADLQQIFTGKPSLDEKTLSAIRKYADAVVLLSRKTLDQFIDLGIPAEKCRLLYNFVSETFPAETRKPGQPLQLLFAGQVSEAKGIFDAMAALQKIDAPCLLHVCGDYEDAQTEKRFCQAAEKLGDKLRFHGFVTGEAKKQLFAQADVLLLPSYSEGLPMVILEGYAAGCGVVATAVGAISEIVKKENGILVSPGDIPGLQGAVEQYLSMDPQALQAQQEHNRNCAARYTPERFLEGLAAVCRAVCEP